MLTHAIVELEEGALNVVVGGTEGGTTRLLRSLRLPVADLGRETLTNALRSLGSDALQGASGVHIVLGERRMQHFSSTVPKLPAAEMVAFVTREALRLTNLQSPSDVLIATRILRKLSGNRHVLGTTALARNAWEPIQAAFEANHIAVLGVHSMETCVALAAPAAASGTTAVIECNAGRARFVLCDGQNPVQVRRFLIGGGGEGNAAALTTQLAMELPRTFDWLREIGQTLPSSLLLGTRVTIEDESIELLKGEELGTVARATTPIEAVADMAAPGIGVAMLLDRLGRGQKLPSLLDPPRVDLPVGLGRVVGVMTTLAAGLACSVSAVVDGSAWMAGRDALQVLSAEKQRLEAEIASRQVTTTAPDAATVAADDRLQAALRMRRPTSRLLADVSNAAEPTLQLEELKFASTDRILVTGVVSGKTRREALSTLAVFSQRLRALAYLQPDGQDEVGEVQGQRNRFRFRLGMAWRNS
ncbi:MAG: hypothetical protein JNK15_06340 [Planctomycetes bacterium]|nr:hypothetical protein [Planctomycetota bacterium]